MDVDHCPLEWVVTAVTKHGLRFQYRPLFEIVKGPTRTVVMPNPAADNVVA